MEDLNCSARLALMCSRDNLFYAKYINFMNDSNKKKPTANAVGVKLTVAKLLENSLHREKTM